MCVLVMCGAMLGALGSVVPRAPGPAVAASRPSTRPGPVLALDVKHPPASTQPRSGVLGGANVSVIITGPIGRDCTWRLMYDNQSVTGGRLVFDAAGAGRFKFVMPDVRVRAECELVALSGSNTLRCRLTAFPRAGLAIASKLIGTLRIGVIDSDGSIGKTLAAEGVACENLSTRLEQDAFEGGAVIIAGRADRAVLSDICLRLKDRIKNGMFVIVANPPKRWSLWGVSAKDLTPQTGYKIAFAQRFGWEIKPADLAGGPRPMMLSTTKKWNALVWLDSTARPDKKQEAKSKHPLACYRRMGRGQVLAATFPELADPLGDAVGRGVLDSLVMWVLKERFGEKTLLEKKNE